MTRPEPHPKPITYSMQFRGRATPLSPHVLATRASAPGGSLARGGDAEAILRSQVTFAEDGSFEESGEISFGNGDRLRFRTVGRGVLDASPDPHLRHGTVMWEIDGGQGRFRLAKGRITSNFFVSDTGEITDNQLGVLFLDDHDVAR